MNEGPPAQATVTFRATTVQGGKTARPHPPPDPGTAPSTGLLIVGGPIADGDVRRLTDRLRAVIAASDARTIVCDVGSLPASIHSIGVLARLQLTARRDARRIRLQRASRELEQLLELAGFADVLPLLLGERHRHPEQRVHPFGVEERVDRGDPPARDV